MTQNHAKIIRIGTHNGVFHCDESLACFLLKLLPQYQDAEIIRSRDPTKLSSCDIVLDVGGLYNPETHRYDHHQKEFDLTLSKLFPKKTFGDVKLSSAGLIFCHFGHKIISHISNFDEADSRVDTLFDIVYKNFIKEVDAIDNGINMFNGSPLYEIQTNLSRRISRLNLEWNEIKNDESIYQRFLKAVELTGKEFLETLNYYVKVWLAARELVLESFKKRFENDPSGRIMVFDRNLPWIEHLFDIEQELNIKEKVLFILFKDENWRVRAVPISPNSFTSRNALCEKWRGLRDEELSAEAKIKECVFVHSTGFIGANKTFDGALKMAKKSLIVT